MYIALFFVFAFLTVFLSIKLSFYSDMLSNSSKVNKALIGGILLAGITSLPEFVTSISATLFGNPNLAIGDILGSNLFNIFMVSFFDIFFISKMMFNNTGKEHFIVYILLLVNYIFIFLYFSGLFSIKFFNIGFPSLIIFITYFYYLFSVSKREDDGKKEDIPIGLLVLKLVIVAIFMIFSSIMLTFVVNKIAVLYPSFSSSLIGAILLGVTTSLPEVITFYTLFRLNNYDLALSNIIGSNLFNLLVLSVSDIFYRTDTIYAFSDSDAFLILILGFITMFISLMGNVFYRKNKFIYIVPSLFIVFIYALFWVFKFVL